MKSLLLLCVIVLVSINGIYSEHLVIGNVANRVVLAHKKTVEYNAIPFIKRVKYFFYSDPRNRNIQGIQALDVLHTNSSINITAGGVGHSFVNLQLVSERGTAIQFDIGIYVNPDFV